MTGGTTTAGSTRATRGELTRRSLIETAERLATERGLGAMSLREVQGASGQRNKSAAAYHFRDREGLVEAVVEARMAPANERRAEMLADLDAAGGGSVTELVEALVVPLAEASVLRPGSTYARFLQQGLSDPLLQQAVRTRIEARPWMETCERLRDRLTHVLPTLRADRVERVAAMVVSAFAAQERRADGIDASAPPGGAPTAAEVVADVVATAAASLLAPAATTSAPTTHADRTDPNDRSTP